MILVSDVYDEARDVFAIDKQEKLFRLMTDAVQLLANKGEVDPLVGYVDICVTGQCITLPREVETILACNIGGHAALGHDELFSFHLNGPGDFSKTCDYSWFNVGNFATYRDLPCPSKLIAFVDNAADAGKMLKVFGFDDQNRPLRYQSGGIWYDGYLVPTIYGYAVPDSTAPTIARITGIVKDRTVANVRLSSIDNSTSTGTLLGVYEPDEVLPQYRRIRISRGCNWVRICYRKRTLDIQSVNDRILLHSRPALVMAFQAIKKYRETELATALQLEAQATRLLTEREASITSPTPNPIQVVDRSGIGVTREDDLS